MPVRKWMTLSRKVAGAAATPGPSRAFEEIVTAHLDSLYRTALRLCAGSKPDAEDLLQESMLRALRCYGELRDPAAARSWLFTILVRVNLNRLRTRQRRGETFTSDLGEAEFEAALEAWHPSATANEAIEHIDMVDRLTESLDKLDEPLRQIIWLADAEGFRQTELAKMLDLPEGTVASRLFRARRQLRESIEHGAAPPSERKA